MADLFGELQKKNAIFMFPQIYLNSAVRCFVVSPRYKYFTGFQSKMSCQAINGATKAEIRQRVWDHIEKNDLANFPRPVHHRIPNFRGANAAGEKVVAMDAFKKAQTVKVNPDKPQEYVRYKTLEERKLLLVPTPRLRNGLFNRIVPPHGADTAMLKRCATREGVTNYSTPVGLDHRVNIDLIVIGSVAVSTKGSQNNYVQKQNLGRESCTVKDGQGRCMVNSKLCVISRPPYF